MKIKKDKYTEILLWADAKESTPFTETELFTIFNPENDPNFRDWYVQTFRTSQNNSDCLIGIGQYINNEHRIYLTAKGKEVARSINNKKMSEKLTWFDKYVKKAKNNKAIAILIIIVIVLSAVFELRNTIFESFSNTKNSYSNNQMVVASNSVNGDLIINPTIHNNYPNNQRQSSGFLPTYEIQKGKQDGDFILKAILKQGGGVWDPGKPLVIQAKLTGPYIDYKLIGDMGNLKTNVLRNNKPGEGIFWYEANLQYLNGDIVLEFKSKENINFEILSYKPAFSTSTY